ncbi:hypothetical protein T484DRAFT_1830387, partial [Baffinella frigidus]
GKLAGGKAKLVGAGGDAPPGCRVGRDELVEATLDRYALAADMVASLSGELCGTERTAGWSAAHLIVVGADYLALTAKVAAVVGETHDLIVSPVPVAPQAAGAVGDAASAEGLAINALGIAAGERKGVRFASGTRGGASAGGKGGFDSQRDIFYTSGDASEARLLLPPISALASRLAELLSEFPEHSILEQLQGLCQRLMSLPLDSPLAKLLTGLELLHRKALEWESYAAKHVSILSQLDGVERLIMRWHRLLVHTWPAMLVERARACTRPVAASYLSLSSVIQARADEGGGGEELGTDDAKKRRGHLGGGYQVEKTKTWKEDVHETLRGFLERASLGEDVYETLRGFLERASLGDCFTLDPKHQIEDVHETLRGFLERASLGDIAARMDLLRVLLQTLEQRAQAQAQAQRQGAEEASAVEELMVKSEEAEGMDVDGAPAPVDGTH